MRLGISEIINELPKFKGPNQKKEKIAWLQKHESWALKEILKYTYDKRYEFLLPDSIPPYRENKTPGGESFLYKETKRLRIFIKGGGYDNLNQVKRESLFISLLEDLDAPDAKTLCNMIMKKPFKGLRRDTLEAAFPGLLGDTDE